MKKQIKGFEDYWIDTEGNVWSMKSGEMKGLKGTDNGQGYLMVELYQDRKGKLMRVHRLVAKTFLDNPDNYPQVNHKNGIKSDNRLENLEWCNQSMNQKHAFDLGLQSKKGVKHHLAKLTEEQVIEIFRRLDNGESPTEIAKDYPVGRCAISGIKHGKNWSHLKY